jgi:hypothetical protein
VTMPLTSPLLTMEDAARLLSVKPSTVYEWPAGEDERTEVPTLRSGVRAFRALSVPPPCPAKAHGYTGSERGGRSPF